MPLEGRLPLAVTPRYYWQRAFAPRQFPEELRRCFLPERPAPPSAWSASEISCPKLQALKAGDRQMNKWRSRGERPPPTRSACPGSIALRTVARVLAPSYCRLHRSARPQHCFLWLPGLWCKHLVVDALLLNCWTDCATSQFEPCDVENLVRCPVAFQVDDGEELG